MQLFHENPIFETVRLSVSISPRNLYNSSKSIKEFSNNSIEPGISASGVKNNNVSQSAGRKQVSCNPKMNYIRFSAIELGVFIVVW